MYSPQRRRKAESHRHLGKPLAERLNQFSGPACRATASLRKLPSRSRVECFGLVRVDSFREHNESGHGACTGTDERERKEKAIVSHARG